MPPNRHRRKPPSARQLTVEESMLTSGDASEAEPGARQAKGASAALGGATTASAGSVEGLPSTAHSKEPPPFYSKSSPTVPSPRTEVDVQCSPSPGKGLPVDRQAWAAKLGTAMEQLLLTRRSDGELVLRLMEDGSAAPSVVSVGHLADLPLDAYTAALRTLHGQLSESLAVLTEQVSAIRVVGQAGLLPGAAGMAERYRRRAQAVRPTAKTVLDTCTGEPRILDRLTPEAVVVQGGTSNDAEERGRPSLHGPVQARAGAASVVLDASLPGTPTALAALGKHHIAVSQLRGDSSEELTWQCGPPPTSSVLIVPECVPASTAIDECTKLLTVACKPKDRKEIQAALTVLLDGVTEGCIPASSTLVPHPLVSSAPCDLAILHAVPFGHLVSSPVHAQGGGLTPPHTQRRAMLDSLCGCTLCRSVLAAKNVSSTGPSLSSEVQSVMDADYKSKVQRQSSHRGGKANKGQPQVNSYAVLPAACSTDAAILQAARPAPLYSRATRAIYSSLLASSPRPPTGRQAQRVEMLDGDGFIQDSDPEAVAAPPVCYTVEPAIRVPDAKCDSNGVSSEAATHRLGLANAEGSLWSMVDWLKPLVLGTEDVTASKNWASVHLMLCDTLLGIDPATPAQLGLGMWDAQDQYIRELRDRGVPAQDARPLLVPSEVYVPTAERMAHSVLHFLSDLYESLAGKPVQSGGKADGAGAMAGVVNTDTGPIEEYVRRKAHLASLQKVNVPQSTAHAADGVMDRPAWRYDECVVKALAPDAAHVASSSFAWERRLLRLTALVHVLVRECKYEAAALCDAFGSPASLQAPEGVEVSNNSSLAVMEARAALPGNLFVLEQALSTSIPSLLRLQQDKLGSVQLAPPDIPLPDGRQLGWWTCKSQVQLAVSGGHQPDFSLREIVFYTLHRLSNERHDGQARIYLETLQVEAVAKVKWPQLLRLWLIVILRSLHGYWVVPMESREDTTKRRSRRLDELAVEVQGLVDHVRLVLGMARTAWGPRFQHFQDMLFKESPPSAADSNDVFELAFEGCKRAAIAWKVIHSEVQALDIEHLDHDEQRRFMQAARQLAIFTGLLHMTQERLKTYRATPGQLRDEGLVLEDMPPADLFNATRDFLRAYPISARYRDAYASGAVFRLVPKNLRLDSDLEELQAAAETARLWVEKCRALPCEHEQEHHSGRQAEPPRSLLPPPANIKEETDSVDSCIDDDESCSRALSPIDSSAAGVDDAQVGKIGHLGDTAAQHKEGDKDSHQSPAGSSPVLKAAVAAPPVSAYTVHVPEPSVFMSKQPLPPPSPPHKGQGGARQHQSKVATVELAQSPSTPKRVYGKRGGSSSHSVSAVLRPTVAALSPPQSEGASERGRGGSGRPAHYPACASLPSTITVGHAEEPVVLSEPHQPFDELRLAYVEAQVMNGVTIDRDAKAEFTDDETEGKKGKGKGRGDKSNDAFSLSNFTRGSLPSPPVPFVPAAPTMCAPWWTIFKAVLDEVHYVDAEAKQHHQHQFTRLPFITPTVLQKVANQASPECLPPVPMNLHACMGCIGSKAAAILAVRAVQSLLLPSVREQLALLDWEIEQAVQSLEEDTSMLQDTVSAYYAESARTAEEARVLQRQAAPRQAKSASTAEETHHTMLSEARDMLQNELNALRSAARELVTSLSTLPAVIRPLLREAYDTAAWHQPLPHDTVVTPPRPGRPAPGQPRVIREGLTAATVRFMSSASELASSEGGTCVDVDGQLEGGPSAAQKLVKEDTTSDLSVSASEEDEAVEDMVAAALALACRPSKPPPEELPTTPCAAPMLSSILSSLPPDRQPRTLSKDESSSCRSSPQDWVQVLKDSERLGRHEAEGGLTDDSSDDTSEELNTMTRTGSSQTIALAHGARTLSRTAAQVQPAIVHSMDTYCAGEDAHGGVFDFGTEQEEEVEYTDDEEEVGVGAGSHPRPPDPVQLVTAHLQTGGFLGQSQPRGVMQLSMKSMPPQAAGEASRAAVVPGQPVGLRAGNGGSTLPPPDAAARLLDRMGAWVQSLTPIHHECLRMMAEERRKR